jgi:integrase/recombinase XerD
VGKRLGALILSGFKKRSTRAARGRRSANRSGTATRSRRALEVRVSARPARKSRGASVTPSVIAAVPALSPPTVLPPARESHVEPINALSSLELTRPGERLQKSIESFLLDQRSPHTRRAYGKDLKRFVKFLLGRQAERRERHGDQTAPENLTRSLIIAYKDSLLSENLEHTTIDRHLSTLRSFFRWLVEDGILPKSPAENVRFLNPKRESRTQGFTNEEVAAILKKPNLHLKSGSMHYAILMTLFYCGLRRSELCDLRTSHLQIERGQRFLRLRGKGNSERIVILTPPVWNAIRHYLRMTRKDPRLDQPLFTPVRNNRSHVLSKPIDSSMVFYIVKKYSLLAGVQNRVSPHSCRATAISNARDHNVPDRAIQEFAGWSTPNMITRYDKRKSALEKSAAHAISYGAPDRDLPYLVSDDDQKV